VQAQVEDVDLAISDKIAPERGLEIVACEAIGRLREHRIVAELVHAKGEAPHRGILDHHGIRSVTLVNNLEAAAHLLREWRLWREERRRSERKWRCDRDGTRRQSGQRGCQWRA
jgi:hypothetical protein